MTGIGTMIIFISLVITAAIGATVVLNETSYLQQKAGSAGKKSVHQVTSSIQFMSVNGLVDGENNITRVHMNVFRAPGADKIDLSVATVTVRGEHGSKVLTYNASGPDNDSFAVRQLYDKDKSAPVLNEQPDRAQIVLELNESYDVLKPLETGDTLHIHVSSRAGASAVYKASAPWMKDMNGSAVGL